MKTHSKIVGVGHAVPNTVMTNNDFVARGLDTSDEWIQERTGIKERRIADADTYSSDLAYQAAQNAIQNTHYDKHKIDLIVVATSTQDYDGFPSVACLVQQKLGLGSIPAFDLAAACTGFCYALTTAQQFIENGTAKSVLVIGVDVLSKVIDWTDRGTCILFGDGAGAVILEPSETPHLLYSRLYADGSESDILYVEDRKVKMEGRAVFKSAIKNVVPCVEESLKEANLTPEDIDYLIPHQANSRIIEQMRIRLNLEPEQVMVNLDKYGNTSAASIPIALSEAVSNQKIKSGDIVMFVGFGAGFTWGVNIVRWE